MRSSYFNDLLKNQEPISLEDFLKEYNKSAPSGFPPASKKSLKEFQEAHPSLFKREDEWCVDRHRKRFMDWSFSNKRET